MKFGLFVPQGNRLRGVDHRVKLARAGTPTPATSGPGGGFDGARADLVTANEIRVRLEQLAEVGIEYVIAYIPGVAYDHEPMQRFAEDVVPAFS